MHNDRGENRQQFLRIKQRRIKQNHCGIHDQNGKIDGRRLGRAVVTAKTCSCWMCNRHRKVFGPNMNEIRRLDKCESQIKEI
ncbi:hypothetical protein D3C87_605330 [compost metagenome]